MKKRPKMTDTGPRPAMSESGHNGSRMGQVTSIPDTHTSLDEEMHDEDRATLLRIGTSMSALIRNADKYRMTRLGHLLRLVRSEAQGLLDKKEPANQ